AEKPKFPLDIMSLPSEKFLFQLSWGPDVIETGVPTTFVMNIQDPATGDLVRGSSFDFVLTQDGREIHRQHLSSDFGTYAYDYTFAKAGTVTLSASNINGQGESASIDLVVLQGSGDTVPEPPQQPSGCLIATAAFGSELTPQVQYLRNFRDHYILSTASGSAFMNSFYSIYYSFSPQVADYEREQPWLQSTVKAALYPLFGILTAAERTHAAVGGEAGAIAAGATASALIGTVYLVPAGYVASKRVSGKLLLIVVGAAAGALAITLVALPALLPISTSAFVVAAAGTSAIAAAKVVYYIFRKISPT
ncbi:MAG: CFI-box-CTERM domain-containing protein, partial [Nitrososphaera sp.]